MSRPKFIKTADGNVRAELLRPEVVDADIYVREMYKTRMAIVKAMIRSRGIEKDLTEEYLDKKAKDTGLTEWDGFAVDYSADGTIKVETKFSEIVAIDTNVSAGIQMISEWVENLQPDLNQKIRIILKDVLTVKSSGKISKSQLNKLCSYGFKDKPYQEAVKLILENMKVIEKKSYTDISVKKEVEEDRGKGVKVYVDWVKIGTNYASM